MRVTSGRTQGELVERLRARRQEVEAAVRTRVFAVADAEQAPDPVYAEGLRAAVSAALDYGLAAIEISEDRPPELPLALLGQARLAARNGVGIDTVLRRYFAGYTLLGEFIAQEAAELDLGGVALRRLVHTQAAALDRLLAAVSEEYEREMRPSPASTEGRRLRLVQRLLAREPVDAAELRYPFDAEHVGLVVAEPGAEAIVAELASRSGCAALFVRPAPGAVWAWLGGRRTPDSDELLKFVANSESEWTAIGIGESAGGLPGWRLTHRQAATASPIALRSEHAAIRYADIALLASAQNDDLLVAWLRSSYLDPLDRARHGGAVARATLRAYLQAGHNVSSAAAILGASRTTVGSRLRAIEEAIGRTVPSCAAELQVALDLDG